jgi:hypothetical protein
MPILTRVQNTSLGDTFQVWIILLRLLRIFVSWEGTILGRGFECERRLHLKFECTNTCYVE